MTTATNLVNSPVVQPMVTEQTAVQAQQPATETSNWSRYALFTVLGVLGGTLAALAAFTASGALVLKVAGIALLALGLSGVASGVIPAISDRIYTAITGKQPSEEDAFGRSLSKAVTTLAIFGIIAAIFVPVAGAFTTQFVMKSIYPWYWYF